MGKSKGDRGKKGRSDSKTEEENFRWRGWENQEMGVRKNDQRSRKRAYCRKSKKKKQVEKKMAKRENFAVKIRTIIGALKKKSYRGSMGEKGQCLALCG